jgi:3-oxoacyl-[acyl-carrier protein] reductase
MQLQGTVAIVTGGNGGLGQRICHALAREGSDVAVVYAQSHDSAKSVAAELRSTGVRAEAMACDVTSPSEVQSLVSRVVETFGRVDLLVNDAAYNKWIPFNDLDAMTYEVRIPSHFDHRFHGKSITDSTPIRSPIPRQSDQ